MLTQNIIKCKRLSGNALHRPHFAPNPVTEDGNAKRESALRAQSLQNHPACCPMPVSAAVDGGWPSFLKRARSWTGAACKCKGTAQCSVPLARKLELKFCSCEACSMLPGCAECALDLQMGGMSLTPLKLSVCSRRHIEERPLHLLTPSTRTLCAGC